MSNFYVRFVLENKAGGMGIVFEILFFDTFMIRSVKSLYIYFWGDASMFIYIIENVRDQNVVMRYFSNELIGSNRSYFGQKLLLKV